MQTRCTTVVVPAAGEAMTRWTHNGQPVGQPQRPWRLTRAQRVEMEAALAWFRARIVASPRRVDRLDVDDIEDAPLTPGWGQTIPVEPGCLVPSERTTRIARARVAIALRAALRADEDARCEEAEATARAGCQKTIDERRMLGYGDRQLEPLERFFGRGARDALREIREWPRVSRSGGIVQPALWDRVALLRRLETMRAVEALLVWGLS